MEKEQSGSRFRAVFRILLGACIVFIVAFLLVRIISNREDAKTVEQVKKDGLETQQKINSEDKKSTKSTSKAETSNSTDIPKGIADSQVKSNPGSELVVPNVGIDISVLRSAMVVMTVSLFATYFLQRRYRASGL